jgi:hypothetical protein
MDEYRGLFLPDEFMKQKIIKNEEFYVSLNVRQISKFVIVVIVVVVVVVIIIADHSDAYIDPHIVVVFLLLLLLQITQMLT